MPSLTTFPYPYRTRLDRALTYTVTCVDDEGNRLYAFPIPSSTLSIEAARTHLMKIDKARSPMVDSVEYPHGSEVLFGDCTATVPIEEMGETLMLVDGVVAGLPVRTDSGVSVPVVAPIAGRPAGLVYINAANIITITLPYIRDLQDGVFYE